MGPTPAKPCPICTATFWADARWAGRRAERGRWRGNPNAEARNPEWGYALETTFAREESGRGLHALQNLSAPSRAHENAPASWSACSPLPLWILRLNGLVAPTA